MDQCNATRAGIGRSVKNISFAAYNPVNGEFERHSLSSFSDRGKWLILFFYPSDFSLVCPRELAEIAKQHAALKDLGVEVVSVSTDSKYAHLHWRTTEPLLADVHFLMAADTTAALCRYFDTYNEDEGIARRGTIIINPQGIHCGTEVNFYNVGRIGTELVRKMEANVHMAEHEEETCDLAQCKQQDSGETPLDDLYARQSGNNS